MLYTELGCSACRIRLFCSACRIRLFSLFCLMVLLCSFYHHKFRKWPFCSWSQWELNKCANHFPHLYKKTQTPRWLVNKCQIQDCQWDLLKNLIYCTLTKKSTNLNGTIQVDTILCESFCYLPYLIICKSQKVRVNTNTVTLLMNVWVCRNHKHTACGCRGCGRIPNPEKLAIIRAKIFKIWAKYTATFTCKWGSVYFPNRDKITTKSTAK